MRVGSNQNDQTSQMFGLKIFAGSKRELLTQLRQQLEQSAKTKPWLVFTPNPEQIVQAEAEPSFKKILAQGDILLPDGIGLVLANRFWRLQAQWQKIFSPQLSVQLPEKITQRIAGVDVVDQLLIEAAKYNYRTLIIGGRNYSEFWGKSGGEYRGELSESEASLIELKKNLYWTEAYQDKEEILPSEDAAIEKILQKIKPQLVFVALGAPDQEEWLLTWRARLERAGVRVAMAVGGSFDFLFQRVARAPKILRSLGLEWLWRLLQQPWRFKRQLRLIKFMALTARAARTT